MLTTLRLKNFRKFSRQTIHIEPLTLLVGGNNAGKSTVIEALRLVSLVTNRVAGLKFSPPTDWLPDDESWGVSPSLRGFEFRLTRHIFHRYNDPPAEIEAHFASGARVKVSIGPDEAIFGTVRDPSGAEVLTRRDLKGWSLPRIGVQPQVAPLEVDEQILKERTVVEGLDSSLSPRHFRNQLDLLHEYWDEFCRLSNETWQGLQIRELRTEMTDRGMRYALDVRVDDFVGEVAMMGHGLQMWLQLMWFLVRAAEDDIVILDEPDVFMHPDLQRRLIRYLRRRSQQLIVATHSVEMLADVEPKHVVALRTQKGGRTKTENLAQVQKVVEELGGVHNLPLARLQGWGRFVFIEGKDFGILDRLEEAENPGSLEPFGQIPHETAQGWGDWQQIIGAAIRLRQQFGNSFVVYAVYDSDYRTPKVLAARRREASKLGICLHIWGRKEIENYLLVPSAVGRCIAESSERAPTPEEIAEVMEEFAVGMRETTVDALMDAAVHSEKGVEPSTLRSRVSKRVDSSWSTFDGKMARVPGKKMCSEVSRWSKEAFGVSISRKALALALEPGELDAEARQVLTAISRGEPFP